MMHPIIFVNPLQRSHDFEDSLPIYMQVVAVPASIEEQCYLVFRTACTKLDIDKGSESDGGGSTALQSFNELLL